MFYALLYLFQHAIVSMLLACVCLRIPCLLSLKKIVRFLFGVILTPFFIGFTVFLVGLIPFSLPRIILILTPTAIALMLFFCFYRLKEIRYESIKSNLSKKLSTLPIKVNIERLNKEFILNIRCKLIPSNVVVVVISIFAAILILIPFSNAIFLQAQTRVIDHDISHYLLQARYFAQTGNSWEIGNYSGYMQAGTGRPDDHGPLWPAYLGQALMFNPRGHMGDPHDLTARLAVILTFCYLLLAIIATTLSISKDKRVPIFSVAMIFLFPRFFSILRGLSRDAFSGISILILIIYLCGLSLRLRKLDEQDKKSVSILDCSVLALLTYFCMQGHGSNAFYIPFFGLIFGILLLVWRVRFRYVFYAGISMLIGLLIPLINNIRFFLNDGSFRSFTTTGLDDTPLFVITDWIPTEGFTLSDRISVYFSDIGALVLIIGLLGIPVSIICYFVYTRKKGDNTLRESDEYITFYVFSLLLIGIILPMTGLFDIGNYRISDWYILNFRYRFPLYVVCAISAGGLFGTLAHKYAKKALINITLSLLLLTSCFLSVNMQDVNDRRNSNRAIITYWQDVLHEAEQLSNGKRIVTNHDPLNYHAQTPGFLFPHPHLRPLKLAETMDELLYQIEEFSIGAFVMIDESSPVFDNRRIVMTPLLLEFFENPELSERILMETDASVVFSIYVPR